MATVHSVREVARLLGVSRPMVDRWVRDGIVKPMYRAPGKGGSHLFSALDILGVALAKHLREQGMSLKCIAATYRWLSGQTLEGLHLQWSAGNCLLLVARDGAFPQLLSHSSLPTDVFRGADQAGASFAVINLAKTYFQMSEQIEKFRQSATSEAIEQGHKHEARSN